ncbi:DNA-binding IscR family transcriptional regulator [Clostridium beijerinckii]|jgi:DNA-binding IscR family transcriptional regulator|nr:DNA-binding IscR family transcriptional regulator [Clostridium beijerinckii]NOV73089.1 DNA-binding IscR family transcriptional regulator [Clostridium beijerinckii]NOW33318.1 DNA-binding IscR family transcriptional regulator [Clostridium beijerinckii]
MMQISSRFTVAIHILAALEISNDVCTSEVIAGSIQNNPVVVRRIIGMLKKAELVDVNSGGGGAYLLKPVEDITLFDVYKAVDVVEDEKLFQIHENTNQECIIGANIQDVLMLMLPKAQSAMEEVLKSYTMADIVTGILEKKLN